MLGLFSRGLTSILRPAPVSGSLAVMTQERCAHLNNQGSMLQRFYNHRPIRKRYIRALKRGTMIWDRGQVRIPQLAMEGYKLGEYKGKIENLRSRKIWFHD